MRVVQIFLSLFFILPINKAKGQVLVIGGGASGTAAALQAARLGARVIIIEETPWLGGMLTSAGVSGIDGNHNLPSGIWGEFKEKLYTYYGSPEAVSTGWVSNTLFEPHVEQKILFDMVALEKNIELHLNAEWKEVTFSGDRWTVTYLENGAPKTAIGQMLIDATELGDVAAYLKYPYYIGMDSRDRFNEKEAPTEANNIIQDLTFVAILKDFGAGTNKTIAKPKNYDPTMFSCACSHADPIGSDKPRIDCDKMLSYAKLPEGKYLINWPNCGNDFYLNLIELSKTDRAKAVEAARQHTLQFVYYIQQELGYKHLGLADDEFPTKDRLPLIPYYRESRRLQTEATLTLPYVAEPYHQINPLYRTGITVGDYPIDHHHKKYPEAPAIDFIKIRVPSFNLPIGSLVPKGSTHFIVAEKSIGVSNIVNGATRLQPVVLGIGQAAGALAATAIKFNLDLQHVNIRTVQESLLRQGAYLMPFMDVTQRDLFFAAVQRIGATGIMKGYGVPYQWANQTWFYPNREISEYELISGLRLYYKSLESYWAASGKPSTINYLKGIFSMLDAGIDPNVVEVQYQSLSSGSTIRQLNRWQAAVLIDEFLKPFQKEIDWWGKVKE